MPKLEDIKLGVSPLTDRVYLGTVSKKDAGLWLQKRDCVSDFCAALFTWVEPGTVRVIDSSSGERYEIEVRKVAAALASPPATKEAKAEIDEHEDTRLLDFLADEYLTLEAFDMPTGGGDSDVGWRTVQHHMGRNHQRVASEVFADDPRRAIREAIDRLARDPHCIEPLHPEEGGAPQPTAQPEPVGHIDQDGRAYLYSDAPKSATLYATPFPVGEPVAWIRKHPDGLLSDELLPEWQIERVRKESGAWVPLYAAPAPAAPAGEQG